MKSGDWKMTVEHLQGGQTDNYKPTVDRLRVYFAWLPYKALKDTGATKFWEPLEWGETLVRPYLKVIQPWCEEGEGDWASPRLKEMKKVGPGTWEFTVEAPYTG